jgi:hypothetical protein
MILAWQFTAWKECEKRGLSERDGMRGVGQACFSSNT